MSGPFTTPRLCLSPQVGPHELLDIIAAAEAAEMDARKAKRRADEAVARYAKQHGQPFLRWPEARRIAIEEAAARQPARKRWVA